MQLELNCILPTDIKELNNLFDQEILPVLCFGAEAWLGVSKKFAGKNASGQAKFLEIFCCIHRSLRRNFLGEMAKTMTHDDRDNDDLKLLEYTSRMKHEWAGQVMRTNDNRWTKVTLGWIPKYAGGVKTDWLHVFSSYEESSEESNERSVKRVVKTRKSLKKLFKD